MVRILTSAPVRIQERTKPSSFVLGKTALGGGKRIEDRFLRNEPAPSFMLSPSRKDTAFFVIELEEMKEFRTRFGERGPDILRQICQIVSREMPAQVVFTIQFRSQPIDLETEKS